MQRLKKENMESNLNDLEVNTRILLGVGLIILFMTSVVAFEWPLWAKSLILLASIYLIYTAGVKKCFVYDILGIESPFPGGKEG